MSGWYAYTGESLIYGQGRLIKRIVADQKKVGELLVAARESYKTLSPRIKVSEMAYIGAAIALLATQELPKSSKEVTVFSSLKQILNLFDGLDIEQVAINFLNGRTVSTYSDMDMVAQGFASGELLSKPLEQSPEILNKLPGIIVFLLGKSNAQRKAFSNYLRKGIPPRLSNNDYTEIFATLVLPAIYGWKKCCASNIKLWCLRLMNRYS